MVVNEPISIHSYFYICMQNMKSCSHLTRVSVPWACVHKCCLEAELNGSITAHSGIVCKTSHWPVCQNLPLFDFKPPSLQHSSTRPPHSIFPSSPSQIQLICSSLCYNTTFSPHTCTNFHTHMHKTHTHTLPHRTQGHRTIKHIPAQPSKPPT